MTSRYVCSQANIVIRVPTDCAVTIVCWFVFVHYNFVSRLPVTKEFEIECSNGIRSCRMVWLPYFMGNT